MSEKGSGLPENYTRFYQGELRIRLAGQLLYVRVQYIEDIQQLRRLRNAIETG